MTIKFRKPMKLGVVGESWLRHEVLGRECTAATCLYFFWARLALTTAGFDAVFDPLACELAGLLVMALGASVAVTVAVLMAVAIMVVAEGIINVDGKARSH
jgi:hypothetical protein